MVTGIIRVVASVLLVLCTPVLLVSSNLRWLALSPAQYEAGHTKYGVAGALGVTQEQINAASKAIIEYLQSSPDSLPRLLVSRGLSPSFFSQRDMLHLVDVHGLVQMVFGAQLWSLVLAVVSVIAIVLTYSRCRDEKVASRALWGGGLTIVALSIIGLISFSNFDAVFLQFHFFAFSNDFWRLDPQVDRLILMFPPNFFYDMMLRACVQSFVQAAIVVTVAASFLVVKRRHRQERAVTSR